MCDLWKIPGASLAMCPLPYLSILTISTLQFYFIIFENLLCYELLKANPDWFSFNVLDIFCFHFQIIISNNNDSNYYRNKKQQ